jgi:SNF2 family DNA or RNA helicase
MKFVPHDYQKYAIEFIEKNEVAAVLLDMGLGKTVIALSAVADLKFDSFEVEKVLVIGPLRVARDTWPAEVKKWDHLKDLKVSVAVGTETERRMALMRKADVYVINRENIQWLVDKSGMPFDYDMVIIDELSSFKNPQSKRFKALMKVRAKVKRVVGLTGTPASNGLMDLFAEYKLLDMGKRLGRFITSYRTNYFRPDKMNGAVIYSYKPLPFAEEEIYKKIEDITISMKSTDYLQMPEKVMSENTVYMNEKEKEAYDSLRKNLVLELGEGEEITAANAATLCGKLSQMANGAVYTDDGKTLIFHDRKLDALEDMIEAANGKPVMVVYWFKHDLERISERLREKKIVFEKLDTEDSIQRWNAGELPVILLNPASAAHGLNLQAGGSTIIWFGLTWSLELYQQTNGRLWRQGQKSETVVVNHIICSGTIDERILQVLKGKDATQEELIDAVKANLGK